MEGPKISLFTPTNNTQYLEEVYNSIRVQNYENWEWVVLLNGNATDPNPVDSRIKVVRSTCGSDHVGALKREACMRCTGDALLEMDHDDLLVPETLPKIARAIADGAGFVYSDVAVFQFDDEMLKHMGYSPSFGWEQYAIRVYGQVFTATRNFPLSPRMLCEVYYAPDHVRCWSADAYKLAGGHDENLSVGDDHDLICRTYLTGAKFHYTGDCCYLYRRHDSNTVKARQDAIIKQQNENRRRHITPLIKEWCRREQLPELDLQEGMKKGWYDRITGMITDFADAGITMPECCYGHIIAGDVLQFLSPERFVEVINWLHKFLVPGGYLTVLVPSTNGRYADMDPRHRLRLNMNSFLYFCLAEFQQNLPGATAKFDLIDAEEFYPDKNFQIYDMKVLRVTLGALKGQTWPGPKRI